MNREEILKYLSDLLTDEERKEFEKRLETDAELKNEYETLANKLQTLKQNAEPETNEIYFRNLQPSIRAKRNKRSMWKYVPQISFAITAVIVIYLFGFSSSIEKKESSFALDTAIISNLGDEIGDYFATPLEEEFLYLYSISDSEESSIEDILLLNGETHINELDAYEIPVIDDYEFLENISESEFEALLAEIDNFNLL